MTFFSSIAANVAGNAIYDRLKGIQVSRLILILLALLLIYLAVTGKLQRVLGAALG